MFNQKETEIIDNEIKNIIEIKAIIEVQESDVRDIYNIYSSKKEWRT